MRRVVKEVRDTEKRDQQIEEYGGNSIENREKWNSRVVPSVFFAFAAVFQRFATTQRLAERRGARNNKYKKKKDRRTKKARKMKE